MQHQSIAGILNQIQHMVEALGATIIRIRNYRTVKRLAKLGKPSNLWQMDLRAQVLYQRQVLQIHYQNQIKSSKVFISHLPRSEVRQVIAAFGRMRLRSFVGWAIGVVVVRTSRVDLYPVVQALVNDLLPENAMRRWTAANIAHADKQDRVSKCHRSGLDRLHHGAASGEWFCISDFVREFPPNLASDAAFALLASTSRLRGVEWVVSDLIRMRAEAATSSTARSNAASLDLDGTLNPLSLRTNCNDASRISISVAGGSKLKSVFMLRHMVHVFQS